MDGQGLFDAITDSAVLLDKAGRVVNWNAGASSLFGYSKREAIGLSINFIYDRNYAFPKLIQELNSHQKRWQEDTTFIRKNGIKGNCKSYLCPLPLNEQNKITALLIHQNTSLYKKFEEELHHAHLHTKGQLHHLLAGFWSGSVLLVESIKQLGTDGKKIA